jgi:hypothetical protein
MNEKKRLKARTYFDRRDARQSRAEFYKQLAAERLERFLQDCERERRTEFTPGPASVQDPRLSALPGAPRFKTVQFRRTIRREPEDA